MKKLLSLITLIGVITFSSCKYDDDDLWSSVHGLEDRVAKLEELCKQMNTNISSLQTIVEALEENDYVTNVTPVMQDGKEIGYTIVFSKSNPITIYHGKDGQAGSDGDDGTAPSIGVKLDTDGIYYWTLNGEWLTDDHGGKIKAEGVDGNDGTTPKFKIENDYWHISYNNGETWEQLGKATGEDGTGGDSMFTEIDYKTSTDYVIFTLADGTQIKLPTWSAFEALQRLCNETNTNLSSLQAIVTALQNNDYITSVDPLTEDGRIIGYTIKFAKSNPIVIYNGKDGADGNTPVIGVKKDTDGIYYWTLNGEFIVVDGQKIKAQGTDGSDGTDGTTPKLEIREGYWWISYNNGDSWEQLGKATGEDGKDGESIKITQDENNVYFELADGTVITIPKTESSGSSDPENPSDNINFYSINTKYVCVKNWDINGDNELSYEEAAAVKTMDNVIDGAKIDVFDEFQYFINITSVKSSVFSSNLRSIILPKNIINIEDQAFRGCKNLSHITLPANLTSIGNEAFSGCINLSDIALPYALISIGDSAFEGCTGLKTIVLPNQLNKIGSRAFYGCENLGSINIPSGVASIYTHTFTNCLSLFSVNIEEGVEMIDADAFRFVENMITLTLPSSINTIYNWALPSCINNLYVKAMTPPTYKTKSVGHASMYDYGTLLKNFDEDNLKIYIPKGTIQAYQTSPGWSYYKDYFIEYDF